MNFNCIYCGEFETDNASKLMKHVVNSEKCLKISIEKYVAKKKARGVGVQTTKTKEKEETK